MNYSDGTVDTQVHFADEDEDTLCGEDKTKVDVTNDISHVTCAECKEHYQEFTEYLERLAKAPHKPSEYKHILAWGRMMRSNGWYIKQQQERAALDNAPLDATYERNGEWRRYSECENAGTRAEIDAILERIK